MYVACMCLSFANMLMYWVYLSELSLQQAVQAELHAKPLPQPKASTASTASASVKTRQRTDLQHVLSSTQRGAHGLSGLNAVPGPADDC